MGRLPSRLTRSLVLVVGECHEILSDFSYLTGVFRVCPGKGFAEANIWLLAVNFIAMFSMEKAVDSAGNIISIPGDYNSGYIRYNGLSVRICVSLILA